MIVIAVGTGGDAVSFGDDTVPVIAGPCSVESEEQVVAIAKAVKKAGAKLLRSGAFKPRTSPYAFQGLGAQGLEFLQSAAMKKKDNFFIVSEFY